MFRRMVQGVVIGVLPAGNVAALPFVVLAGNFRGEELPHEVTWVGLRHRHRVHLEVGIKFGIGVGIADIGRKIDRGRHCLDLDVDAGLLAGLLDDLLGFLARCIDRGLKDDL